MDVLIIKGRYKHIPVQVHIGSERLCGQKAQLEGGALVSFTDKSNRAQVAEASKEHIH